MRYNLIVSLFVTLLFSCQSRHASLQNLLEEKLKKFDGEAGLYTENLVTGEKITINDETIFPTASMIKVPILIALFQKIEDESLNYRQDLIWFADSINYPYDGGILGAFKDGRKIPLREVISLMITYSDNHASLWCQKLAGGGAAINKWLSDHGFTHTRVNSRTPGRQADWEKFGWGQTTPQEMARLMIMIRNGEAVSISASEEMYRILGNIYWYGEALSQIPPQIKTISKQGAVSDSRSEVVLVNAPAEEYVFCIITNNQSDTSWRYENSGFILIRETSRLLWKYFEPDIPWEPAAGMDKYH